MLPQSSGAISDGTVWQGSLSVACRQVVPASMVNRGGRFTVCLGPYETAASAQAARTRLAKRGYAPLISGSSLTLGSFSSRDRAARLATTLRQAGYDPSVVSIQ